MGARSPSKRGRGSLMILFLNFSFSSTLTLSGVPRVFFFLFFFFDLHRRKALVFPYCPQLDRGHVLCFLEDVRCFDFFFVGGAVSFPPPTFGNYVLSSPPLFPFFFDTFSFRVFFVQGSPSVVWRQDLLLFKASTYLGGLNFSPPLF